MAFSDMAVASLLEHRTTESIIGAFYHIYNRLGFGFLEQVYALALESIAGLAVRDWWTAGRLPMSARR